jgi:aerobic carbon-monoxide dehydrogenase large subunit
VACLTGTHVASYLAMKLGQPLRWIESWMESLMHVGQERDQIHYEDAALCKNGTLLAEDGKADTGA